MNKNLLSIGEFSKIANVHIKSLRYYDKIGVLKPMYVDPATNYRYYSYQQLGILDAISTCIDVGIPLKDFDQFMSEDKTTIYYDKLLKQGKMLAEKKIERIRSNINKIEYYQNKIEHSNQYQNKSIEIIKKEKYLYTIPLNQEISNHKFYNLFITIENKALNAGHQLGYELGKLYIYDKTTLNKYAYIELTKVNKQNNENVIYIPKLKYLSKSVKTTSIDNAQEEFKDLFNKDYKKYVFETELWVSNLQVREYDYELSCSLENK